MDIGSLKVDLDIDLGKLTGRLGEAHKFVENLTKGLQTTVAQLNDLGKASDQSLQKVTKSLSQVVKLSEQLSSSKGGRGLESSLKTLGSVGATLAQTEKEVTGIISNLQKAATSIVEIGQNTQTSTEGMANSVRTINAALTQVSQTIVQQLTSISQAAITASRSVGTVGNSLAGTTETIRSGMRAAADSFDQITNKLTQSAKVMADGMMNVERRSTTSVNAASQAIQGLAAQLDKAQQTFRSASQNASAATAAMAQGAQQAAEKIGNVAATTQQASAKVKQSAVEMAQNVISNTESVAKATQKITDGLKKAAKEISDAVTRLEAAIKRLNQNLATIFGSLKGVGQASEEANRGLVKVNKAQQDAVSGSANLGRYLRVLTTNLFGVNAIAIAVGTSLGNVATQMVGRLVFGLIQSGTQFSTLSNRLAETRIRFESLSEEFQFIVEQARLVGVSVGEMSDRWLNLAEQASATGVSIDAVREAFVRTNQIQSRFRVQTWASGWDQLSSATGRLVVNFDNWAGISSFLITVMEKLAAVLDYIASWIGDANDPLTQARQELEEARKAAASVNEELRLLAQNADKVGSSLAAQKNYELAVLTAKREQEKLSNRILELQQQITFLEKEKKAITGEQRLVIDQITKDILIQGNAELATLRTKGLEQDKLVRLLQAEQKLRSANLHLSELEIRQISERVFLPDVNEIVEKLGYFKQLEFENVSKLTELQDQIFGRTGLIQDLILTQDEYAAKVEEAEERIRQAHNYSWEAEKAIADMRLELRKREQEAMWETAKVATGALSQLFPKTKAFAIANAVINTAEAITKTIAYYGGTPWGWAAAAATGLAGAAQIAAILRTQPGSSSAPPRPSSGGSRTTSTSQAPTPLPKAVEIVIPPGDIWSSERVAELIKRINDEVGNGSVLIATKTRPM